MAKPIVEGVSEGIETLKMQMDYPEHRGSFVIGAYPDLVMHHLPQIVKEFRSHYPGVQIKLLARAYSTLMDLVSAGEVDIGLGVRPDPERPSVDFVYLFKSDFALITPRDHELLQLSEVHLRDIASWPLILLGPNSYSRIIMEQALKREGLSYSITLEMDIVEMVKRYVEAGMGIAVVPDYALQPEDTASLGIRKLTGIFGPTQVGLITLKGKFLSRSVRNFIDTVVAHLRE